MLVPSYGIAAGALMGGLAAFRGVGAWRDKIKIDINLALMQKLIDAWVAFSHAFENACASANIGSEWIKNDWPSGSAEEKLSTYENDIKPRLQKSIVALEKATDTLQTH